MAINSKTLSVAQGTDGGWKIYCTKRSGATQIPFDLTGSEVVLVVDGFPNMRKSTDDSGSGLSFFDEAGGALLLELNFTETQDLPAGTTQAGLERRIGGKQRPLMRLVFDTEKWPQDNA